MAIKNLLVGYNGSESSDAALDAALFMRDKYDAHLTGLLAHSPTAKNQAASNWIPEEVRATIRAAQAQAAKEIEARFKQRVASNPAQDKIHWISKRGNGDDTVSSYARLYDLTIVGRHDAVLSVDQPELHPVVIASSMRAGPLLLPREFDMSTFNDHAVLAWDGKRASARALADTMQILETKSLVTIVTVDDGVAESSLPGISVETALRRHGVNTEPINLKRKGKSVSHRILEYLEQTQPRLLVMGAYEHSKFRQSIIGGVTNAVLKKAKVPVIISH